MKAVQALNAISTLNQLGSIENAIRAIKHECLQSYGFTIGDRDPRLHTDHAGAFMVVEAIDEASLPCRDGSTSNTWAVVGDDVNHLIDLAFDYVVGCDI